MWNTMEIWCDHKNKNKKNENIWSPWCTHCLPSIEIVHPSSSSLLCRQNSKQNPPPNHYCPSQHPQHHFQHSFVSISTSPITILIIPDSSHCFLSPSLIIISLLTPCLDPCHLEVFLLSFEWDQNIFKLQCSMTSNYNAPSQIRFLLEHAKSRC
jgi:hypothetical protein